MDEEKKDGMDAVHAYWQGFPEAPASDSLKWIDTQGFEHLSTVRAWSPEFLFKAMGRLQVLIINGGGEPINSKPKPAPVATIQERDESGIPVVDAEGQPSLIKLPDNTHVFSVKALFHDKTKNGKDVLKIVTAEEPYNTKYGVACFHGGPTDWKNWPVGVDNKYAPVPEFAHVVIRDPHDDNKYAEVVEFRA